MTEEEMKLEVARISADAQERLALARDQTQEKIEQLQRVQVELAEQRARADAALNRQKSAEAKLRVVSNAYLTSVGAFRAYGPRLLEIRRRREESNARELQRIYKELEALAPEFLETSRAEAEALQQAVGAK